MKKFRISVKLEDGTMKTWEGIYPTSVDAQMDALFKMGCICKVKVEPL